ncbi:isoamylase early set domain-containing protein [Candidatus Chloroploca sp. Khr17]|uniref:isoamylase early set domain-containing protein n=1 Tax=Candidatus Chloroploca sp. Khr17 TaxID=2496869 RepID=UPI00101D4373|nr:isoamylase early set domain-containing protein [Candidatus Chloroploca sp. Khr17]
MVIKHTVPDQPDKLQLTFSVPSSIWADRIYLVGDFNEWNARATPLRRYEEGWSVALLVDRDSRYGYRYLLDDHSDMCDCHADAYARSADGSAMSVVVS